MRGTQPGQEARLKATRQKGRARKTVYFKLKELARV